MLFELLLMYHYTEIMILNTLLLVEKNDILDMNNKPSFLILREYVYKCSGILQDK